MTPTEIVKKLRALALEIEGAATGGKHEPAPAAPAAKAAPKPPSPDSKTVEVEVGFWKVQETKTGKPMGSLSPAGDGDRVYWRIFDEKILLAVDPLRKGERVRATIKPWNDTYIVERLERVASAAGSTGIDEDEIPF